MRRTSAILMTLVLIAGLIIAIPTAASADNTGTEFCKSEVIPGTAAWEFYGFENQGQCVSLVQDALNGNDGPVDLCKFIRDAFPGLWDFLGFKNLGACVSSIRTA